MQTHDNLVLTYGEFLGINPNSLILKYGQIYNLEINSVAYKGIYLGERNAKSKSKAKHLILINRPSKDRLDRRLSFSLASFKDYYFFGGERVILNRTYYVKPFSREISYFKELFEKIK